MTCTPVVHAHLYSTLSQCLALIALIVIISYWMSQKGLSWLRGLVQKTEDQVKALEQKKELLAENQRELDQSIKEQIALFEHFNKIVMQWQSAQEKKVEMIAEQRRQWAHALTANMKKREAMIHKMYLAQRVVPQACEQARVELQEQFSSPEQANRFVSAVCHRIGQRS